MRFKFPATAFALILAMVLTTVFGGNEPRPALPDIGDPEIETPNIGDTAEADLLTVSSTVSPRWVADEENVGTHSLEDIGDAPPTRGGAVGAFYLLDAALSTFNTTVSQQSGLGRKLVDVEVRWTGSQERYTAIFYPVNGSIYTLIQGSTTQWNDFIALMTPKNGRWLDVEVGYFGGIKKYSAIFFENGDNYGHALHTTNSDAGFQSLLQTYRDSGRSIVDFEAYTLPGGQTRFAGVWVNDPNQPITHLYYNLESPDISHLLNPMQGRVIDVDRYYSDLHQEDRYAVIVAMYRGGGWGHYRNQTSTQLYSNDLAISDSNTFLIDLNPVITSSGTLRYDAVWGDTYKSLHEVAAMPAPIDEEPLPATLTGLIDQFETQQSIGDLGLYAKNLRTNQSISHRGDELFYLASSTKTAIHIKHWMGIQAGDRAATDTIRYTDSVNTGSPWYVDERPNPGFSSGAPGFGNDLGIAFPLNTFDAAMMSVSDNGATSALVGDPDFGVAWDSLDLNEWLASQSGIGRGWGVATSIHDVDRFIVWQSQQRSASVGDKSYFQLPGFALEARFRNDWDVCTVGSSVPVDCVSQTCQRCDRNATPTGCGQFSTCVKQPDPWGDLADFFNLDPGDTSPTFDTSIGYPRYYNMNLNQATPRAVGNLWEGLAEGRWLNSANTALALGNMNAGSTFDDSPTFPFGITVTAKGGTKSQSCSDTAMFQYRGETIVLNVLTKNTNLACSATGTLNDIRDTYMRQLGEGILRALGSDVKVSNPSTEALASPLVLRPDESLIYFARISNEGGGDADSVDVDFYLSPNTAISVGDTLIATERTADMDGYAYENVLGNTPLPDLPRGNYYLGWLIDPNGELPEFDENNSGFYPTPITIQARLQPIEDFRFNSKTSALWSEIVDASNYRIYQGASSALPKLGTSELDSCRVDIVTTPEAIGRFADTPPPGKFYWYQIAAEGDGPILEASAGPRLLDSIGECGVSCAQPKCSQGVAMEPACDSCVALICDVDPYCCNNSWDAACVREVRTVCGSLTCDESAGSCDHPVCTFGVSMDPGCDVPPLTDSCVSAICAVDPYCCNNTWDTACIAEVNDFCGATCD